MSYLKDFIERLKHAVFFAEKEIEKQANKPQVLKNEIEALKNNEIPDEARRRRLTTLVLAAHRAKKEDRGRFRQIIDEANISEEDNPNKPTTPGKKK